MEIQEITEQEMIEIEGGASPAKGGLKRQPIA